MKRKYRDLFWGIVLVSIGGFFLTVNLGWIPALSENIWAILFVVFGLLFFAGYLSSGVRNWGLLFPATGGVAIGVTIWLANAGVDGTVTGGLFMIMASIPFWVGYLLNRQKNWGALIPGWGAAALGVILLLAGRGNDQLIGALVMFAIALPFFVVYLANAKNWWALIPGWVLGTFGVIILVSNVFAGELIGALVMSAIALPFFVVYLANRRNRWALIPAWMTAVLAVIILFPDVFAGQLIGALIMFAIALPFFVVYAFSRQNWWALIPAGIVASLGVTILLSGVELTESGQVRVLGGTLFAGMAATFALLWFLRQQHGTDWARYPALLLGGVATLIITFGVQVELVWSLLLIGFGLWLLLKRSSPDQSKEKSLSGEKWQQ